MKDAAEPTTGTARRPEDTGLIPALRYVARLYRLPLSEQAIRVRMSWSSPETLGEGIATAAAAMGLAAVPAELSPATVTSARLPLLTFEAGGDALLIEAVSAEGGARVRLFGPGGEDANEIPLAQVLPPGRPLWAVRPARSLPDARVDGYLAPAGRNWLRETLFPSLRPYGALALASLLVNTLTLAGILFSMQVYDRVIPAQSLNTLAVLASGVALAMAFEYLLKIARARMMDILGKHAGLRLSEKVFGRALRLRGDVRPSSTGSFISQLRDIDVMRETLASTSVGALLDIPFFLLFTALYWYFAGWMVAVPLAALLLMLAPGLLIQSRLRANAGSAQREAARRNAVLVETIQGLDDIKGLQAEERFETIWRETSRATAKAQLEQKRLVNGLTTWTQVVQQSVYAGTVAIGAPLVMAGDLTTGTLVAASILGSRMLAPMSQLTAVLARLQQARVGAQGLDQLVKLPVDVPDRESRISRARLLGGYDLKAAVFRHRPDLPVALTVERLKIRPGETIGILGRNGAGKSTLLQALSGQLLPADGQLLLDGVAIAALDPADLRRDVAYLSQNARLFYGTLRENLVLGQPRASDEEILEALRLAGGASLPALLDKGLDHQIAEGGLGLSGGQRQTILIARLLLRNPSVLLLDEPSSAMDEVAERSLVTHLRQLAAGGRTLVVATHRMTLLSAVERLIVVDGGKVLLDGPKAEVLARLAGEKRDV